MTYNISLFWRVSVRSFYQSANTHGALTRKRIIFLLLFYTFWPAMALFTWACFLLDDLFFPAYRKQPVGFERTAFYFYPLPFALYLAGKLLR